MQIIIMKWILDDTFVRSFGSKRIPIPSIIKRLVPSLILQAKHLINTNSSTIKQK